MLERLPDRPNDHMRAPRAGRALLGSGPLPRIEDFRNPSRMHWFTSLWTLLPLQPGCPRQECHKMVLTEYISKTDGNLKEDECR